MDEYRTDEEQVEALKRWWKEYGSTVLTAIALSMAIIFGYQYWQQSTRNTQEAASAAYDQLVEAQKAWQQAEPGSEAQAQQLKTMQHHIETLHEDHEDTVYAQFANLLKAKLAMDAGKAPEAESALRWVLDQSPNKPITALTQLRLARVLMAQGNNDEALEVVQDISDIDSGIQKVAQQELMGDLYASKGELKQAREAYQAAIDANENGRPNPTLKMKFDNLAMVE